MKSDEIDADYFVVVVVVVASRRQKMRVNFFDLSYCWYSFLSLHFHFHYHHRRFVSRDHAEQEKLLLTLCLSDPVAAVVVDEKPENLQTDFATFQPVLISIQDRCVDYEVQLEEDLLRCCYLP